MYEERKSFLLHRGSSFQCPVHVAARFKVDRLKKDLNKISKDIGAKMKVCRDSFQGGLSVSRQALL
jgi:hypothetical protein